MVEDLHCHNGVFGPPLTPLYGGGGGREGHGCDTPDFNPVPVGSAPLLPPGCRYVSRGVSTGPLVGTLQQTSPGLYDTRTELPGTFGADRHE